MEWRYSKAKMRFQSLFMSTTVHLFSTSAAKACRADDRIVPPSSLCGKSTLRHGPPAAVSAFRNESRKAAQKAYPVRVEVTKHDRPGCKSPGCPAAVFAAVGTI